MVGLYTPESLQAAMDIAQEPESVTQAIGLGGLAPSSADIAGMTARTMRGISQIGADVIGSMRKPPAPSSFIAFSPSANKFYAGGLTFSPDDVATALQAEQRLNAPTPPAPGDVAQDWQFISAQDYRQYMQGLRAPRSTTELLGLGARGAAESTIGGVGRAAQLLGATEAGPALAEYAQRTFGQTEKEQARTALIQQSNSMWSNIVDAAITGAPSLIPTIVAGVAGTVAGGPVGGAAAIGATIFPMELKSFYDAAQKNGYDVNNREVQATMVTAAAGTTFLQTLAPAYIARGASQFFKSAATKAGEEVARGAFRNAARGAAIAGLEEGFAEAASSLAQQAVFDPEFRRQLNANDIKMLAPYIAKNYGEEALISFGAGALLGAGFGGAANFRRTGSVNLSEVADEQAAEKDQAAAREQVYGPPEQQGPRRPVYGPPERQGPPVPTYAYQQQELPLSSAYNPDLGLPLFRAAETPYRPAPAAPAPVAPDVTGLPLFEAAAAQDLQVAPGTQYNLLPNLPEQLPPAPVAGPGVQLSLPLEGQQLALNLQQSRTAPAPLPPRPTEGPMANQLREADFAAAEAQRATETPVAVDINAADVPGDKLKNGARQKVINGYNNLTAAQQDAVLTEFNNDVDALVDYVRSTPATKASKYLANVAGVPPTTFTRKVPTTGRAADATQEGAQPAGGVEQRAPAGKGGQAPEAGRGDSTLRRGQGPQKAKAKRPLKVEKAAPAPTPKVEPKAEPKAKRPLKVEKAAPKAEPKAEPAPTSETEGTAKARRAEWATEIKQKQADTKAEYKKTEQELAAVAEKRLEIYPKTDAKLEAERERILAKQRELRAIDNQLTEDLRNEEALAGPKVNTAFGPGAIVSKADKTGGRYSLRGFNTVTGATGFDGKALPRMASGQVRMFVREFVSKLASKPKVTIFADQADLKTRNPDLYKQAKAAVSKGVDFDAADAAGYYFGDGNIIIFSDRIANKQHLNFVLAHETLGHYGLRGIMPGPQFNALMEQIYTENPRIQLGVDAAMETRGLRKAEAVEEYLSDYAGLLETSIIKRVWDAVKGFLNKLGVKFGDESMRYFLDQSRRYVRFGQQGVAFDAEAVGRRLAYVESGSGDTGRFSVASVRSENEQIASQLQWQPKVTLDIDGLVRTLKDLKLNKAEGWDRLKQQFLSLANFRARENPGAYAFDRLLDNMRTKASSLLYKYDSQLASIYKGKKSHTDNVSRVLYGGRRAAIARFVGSSIPSGKLVTLGPDGQPRINASIISDMLKKSFLTFEEARDGVSFDTSFVDSLGKTQTDKVRFKGVKSLTKEEYADYRKALTVMADAEAELLVAKYSALLDSEELSKAAISRMMNDNKLSAADTSFFTDTIGAYKKLYTAGRKVSETGDITLDADAIAKSNEFIAAVNAAIIGERSDRNAEVKKFFASEPEADAFIKKLEGFKTRRQDPSKLRSDGQQFTFQNEIKHIIMVSGELDRAERQVKQSILSGYIPVIRDGIYETRLQAVIGNKPVQLAPEYQDRLSYSQFDTAATASTAAEQLNKFFASKTFDAIVIEDGGPVVRKVELRAESGTALSTIASDPSLNLEEFLYGLRLFGINPTPGVMADIITTLTETSNSARSKLQYSQTPGADETVAVTAISEHLHGRANATAKILFRPSMRQLMDLSNPETAELWGGNINHVMALKDQVDAAPNTEGARYTQRELDRALYMFRKTNPGVVGSDGKPWDGSRKTQPQVGSPGLRNRNKYYNEASNTLNFLDNNKYVTESNFESGKAVSYVRAFTSVAQLGGSMAQGVLNLASVYTNWAPYMSSYSDRNAFGGGFQFSSVMMEYQRALSQVGLKGLQLGDAFNTAAFYSNIANDPALQKKYKINKREAAFLAREIGEGKMQPAQSNALLSTALGHFTSARTRKFVDVFMSPFNLSEQAARRAAGLAAYRMEFKRAKGSGVSDVEADRMARDFAVESLDYTLGEYSVLNRPTAFRQGLMSFLYMYKVYPTTVVQTFSSLSRAGKLGMATALWLLSGVTGLPFAEDVEDLLDTLAQKMGMTSRGLRVEAARLLDEIMPGVSPYVLKGAMATALGLPADIGSRFSMGDIIPGTGVFLAGAKAAEEFKDVAGPAPAALLGAAQFAIDLATVPFSSTKSLQDVARESPVTAMRMLGDVSAYYSSGAIVDRRGYVVSPDASVGTTISRLLGFYPVAAAKQYEVIKYANRLTNYQKAMSTGYRQAWVKAMIRGDNAEARDLEAQVREWNASARGTGLEIRNFIGGSYKALREAKRPAAERALRAAPRAARGDIEGMIRAFLD